MSKVIECSSVMSEVSRSSVPQAEPQIGPNYFAYCIREIEELFSQKEDFISSMSSKDSLSRTCATVKDNDIEDDHCDGKKTVCPSVSTTLFSNGVEDGLSFFKQERLNALLKQSVTHLSREVDEMLDPVLAMYKIQSYLRAKEQVANNPNSADSYVNQSPYKKQKLLASPSSTGVAIHAGTLSSQTSEGGFDMDQKDHNVVSSEESQCRGVKKTCLDCKTTTTSQWRDGPAGSKTLCNACGIRNKKKRMSPLGFSKVEKLKQELDKDLQITLDEGGSHAKEAVKKHSDGIFAKLGHMEHQLEKYLDVIMSKCRIMTKAEKQELRKLVQNLPPKNLDRVVDIIVQHRKLPEGHPCNEIRIDLENEDNVTLWRLYYYVKVVASVKAVVNKRS